MKEVSESVEDLEIEESFIECIDTMEQLRLYMLKGKRKNKAKGNAKGKSVKKKTYTISEDFTTKAGNSYKAGPIVWEFIPKDISKVQRVRYIERSKFDLLTT